MKPLLGVKVYGTRFYSAVSFVFVGSRHSTEAQRKAERLAKELGLKVFAYTSLSQPRFPLLLEKMSPKLVVPLDSEAYERFASGARFSRGYLKYFSISGRKYAAVVQPDLSINELSRIVASLGALSKPVFNQRVKFFEELYAKSKAVRAKNRA